MERPRLPRIEVRGESLLLHVTAQPGASREGIAGVRNERLLIRVTAPPERGKANDAIVRVLARCLGMRKSAIELLRGESSRRKVFSIQGLEAGELRARLSEALRGIQ